MSEVWGHVIGVLIILLMLAFVGVWVWAWRPRHKKTFGEMSRIPMQDDADAIGQELAR